MTFCDDSVEGSRAYNTSGATAGLQMGIKPFEATNLRRGRRYVLVESDNHEGHTFALKLLPRTAWHSRVELPTMTVAARPTKVKTANPRYRRPAASRQFQLPLAA